MVSLRGYVPVQKIKDEYNSPQKLETDKDTSPAVYQWTDEFQAPPFEFQRFDLKERKKYWETEKKIILKFTWFGYNLIYNLKIIFNLTKNAQHCQVMNESFLNQKKKKSEKKNSADHLSHRDHVDERERGKKPYVPCFVQQTLTMCQVDLNSPAWWSTAAKPIKTHYGGEMSWMRFAKLAAACCPWRQAWFTSCLSLWERFASPSPPLPSLGRAAHSVTHSCEKRVPGLPCVSAPPRLIMSDDVSLIWARPLQVFPCWSH